MPRLPCTPRATALENAAFLRALRRTGNARGAAREIDRAHTTLMHRRSRDPALAQRWDAAIVSAQARLHAKGGCRGPKAGARRGSGSRGTQAAHETPAAYERGHRTAGGEPVVVRVRGGRIQIRAAHPGKLTAACEQAFLLAMTATANVRMSAAAAGASAAAFHRRKRKNPGFARQWGEALALGYERVAMALHAGWTPEAHEHDAWAHDDPPPIPPMTSNQALQLLYLHQKEACGLATPEPLRRRRGESNEARNVRLSLIHEARLEREREKFRATQAALRAKDEDPYWGRDRADPHEPPRPALPDLAQVTGWSKADPAKVPHDETRALFGGWRIGDMRRKMGEG